MMRARPLSVIRCLALLAMLLAFAVASALPSGFMPGRTSGGQMTVVLCTVDGPREMVLDLGHPTQAPASDKGCAWALAHGAATLAEPAALPASNVTLVEALGETGVIIAPIAAPLHRPQARAPPAFA